MEDRRHTEPWKSARPRTTSSSGGIETTEARGPTPAITEDERLRGLSIDGRYEIDVCIGSGGMSRVYSGHHVQTGVRVAIKLIDPALSRHPATKQRLLGEARAMMALQSNHIVRALDVGTLPSGQLYVVMDYLGGENLDALLTGEGPLPWARVAGIGLQICEGLATAHRGGIIHRDIKPQNCILTTGSDGQDLVKIIDFGVAREVRIEAGLTEPGVLPGTPEYIAPELVKPRVRADERTDIYALGATLYKLLTGRVPFQGSTYMETLRRHVHEPLVLPSVAAPERGIPAGVDELIARALAKNPLERFANAGEMARALHAILEGTPHTTSVKSLNDDPSKRAFNGKPKGQEGQRARQPGGGGGESEGGGAGLNSSTPSPENASKAWSSEGPVPDPSRAAARPLDSRFVLLRVSTLMVVSALFMVGTFVIRPRAAASTNVQPVMSAPSAPNLGPKPVPSSSPLPNPAVPVSPKAIAGMEVDEKSAASTSERADVKESAIEVAPGGTKAADRPPVVDDPLIVVDPELPPEPIDPPEPADPAPAASYERKFAYGEARKLIEEQIVYLRKECMGNKARKPLARMKFRADVRPDGRAVISVFSGEKDVRKCVRDLFKFPFESSPNGGAFEYTLTMTSGSLRPVPVDLERLK